MSAMDSLGGQLYARLAELLAPSESLHDAPSCLVLLEPAGKTVGAMQDLGAAERSEAVAAFVNVIPASAPTFLDSGNFYDDTWSFVLDGASATGPSGDATAATVARLVADNKFDLEAMARASVQEPGLTYHPVQTSPANWLGEAGWAQVSFKIGETEQPTVVPDVVVVPEEIPPLTWTVENVSILVEPPIEIVEPPIEIVEPPIEIVEPPVEVVEPPVEIVEPVEVVEIPVLETLPAFRAETVVAHTRLLDEASLVSSRALRSNVLLPEARRLGWKRLFAASRTVDEVAEVVETAPASSGFEISFDYNVVSIHRPWLRSQICNMKGWTIPGLETPVSDGKAVRNTGLMPLITTRMLVVRNLAVKAAWSEEDRAKATDSSALSFGPFSISGSESFDGSELRQPAAQVVAWLGALVPRCPKDEADD